MSLALVQLSTRKVCEFALEEGSYETIQDFIIDVEDKLSAALAEPGKCIRVLFAAVGANPINICDQRRTVHYYLLDAKPWYIMTGVFCSSHADLCVREVNEEDDIEAVIKSDLKRDNVKDLKLKFARMTCRLVNAIHFIFEQKELENEKQLSDCKLISGSVVPCIYSERRLSFGTPYIYITQQGGHHDDMALLQKGSPADGAGPSPVWRRATPGMWLEGLCMNHICPAYSKMVVMNQGFTDLDFITEEHSCKCPICYTVITPVLCGFNKCRWMSIGQKKEVCGAHKFPQIVRQDWQCVYENQQCFCPDITSWSNFKITSRKLNSVGFCLLCTSDLVSDVVTVQCGHVFHGSCLQKTSSACLECLGSETMTAYQQQFN